MRIMEPVLPREMETAIPLEEALAMAAAYEEPVYGYAFAGGSAAGHQLKRRNTRRAYLRTAASPGRRFRARGSRTRCLKTAIFPEQSCWRLRSRRCACGGVSSRG